MKDVKPLFRLTPPEGYEGVKRGFGAGGALGIGERR